MRQIWTDLANPMKFKLKNIFFYVCKISELVKFSKR